MSIFKSLIILVYQPILFNVRNCKTRNKVKAVAHDCLSMKLSVLLKQNFPFFTSFFWWNDINLEENNRIDMNLVTLTLTWKYSKENQSLICLRFQSAPLWCRVLIGQIASAPTAPTRCWVLLLTRYLTHSSLTPGVLTTGR